MPMRLLIAEDERRLAETLGDVLMGNGYAVDMCFDGMAALDNAQSGIYDAIILDVMMPKMDGFEVTRRLRASKVSTPILMLTARSQVQDRVRGLDSGADYYLTKPIEIAELLACLRSLMRRQPEVVTEQMEFGDLRLNVSSCALVCGPDFVKLSSKELELMRLLMAAKGNVVTKETMLLKAWGYDSDASDNNVEVYMSFLRRKIRHIRSGVNIETIRKVGYHLRYGNSF